MKFISGKQIVLHMFTHFKTNILLLSKPIINSLKLLLEDNRRRIQGILDLQNNNGMKVKEFVHPCFVFPPVMGY